MKVLVCGDRDWQDETRMWCALMVLEEFDRCPEIITGGCRGADEMAMEIAYENFWTMQEHLADWAKWGKAAGPIRNQQMLDVGKPDLVLAFHDDIERSKGTKDMLWRAIGAGVPTMLFGNDEVRTW
jgi:hypothetical protein